MIVALLLIFGVLFTGLAALSAAAFGACGIFAMASGVEVAGFEGPGNPWVATGAAFLFAAALGSGLASAYMGYLLWHRYRDWKRWQALKPGRSYWEYAAEAEKERDRGRRSRNL